MNRAIDGDIEALTQISNNNEEVIFLNDVDRMKADEKLEGFLATLKPPKTENIKQSLRQR